MNPVSRWTLVALVTAVVAATPVALRLRPAAGSDVTATALRQKISASRSQAWSGEVSTRGTLQIPDTASFGGVVDLLGEDNTLRAWWDGPQHWRVDDVRQTGEADLVRDAGSLTKWVFESSTATVTPYSAIRLPDPSDILPTRLAARLLSGATAAELSRLPSRRVAGRSAPGLRLEPSSRASTINHVDVWADADTGLPLRVEVSGDGDKRPVITTSFTSVDLGRPSADTVSFTAPRTAKVRSRDAIDVAAGANAFAPFVLPDHVIGLARRADQADLGAVGVYGRGPTALIAIPLRRSLARQVRSQLDGANGSRQDAAGTSLTVGPLSVLVTSDGGPGRFLLAGTVTPQTLSEAAVQLASEVTLR